ncbi:MAG: C10 family peptidase [Bacteroidales bacterium]|nr:C10 family peptidase [Bacteroidales bacterium]
MNNAFDVASFDVGPLLLTSWDQGEWYNYYCPVDPGGPGGHAWAGCVATSMGQIMKYHNFPDHGVLSYSYNHPIYGNQIVSFEDSTFLWETMGSTANALNYQSISSLLYQVGVSVEMDYGINGSGARTDAIPWAFSYYFNYDPTTIELVYKADYDDIAWKELLKAELFASRPLCYGGNTEAVGHQWVCDGWRSGDDMFHMNWGWSGNSNGWFAMGALNPWGGGSYNLNNNVIKGIKPGNPDLIVRITNLKPYQVIGYGPTIEIDCSIIEGVAEILNLYLDSTLVYSTSQANFTYNLLTTEYACGFHTLTLEAVNQGDTAYHLVTVMNNGWVPRASAFNNVSRGINYIHNVDSLIAWATAYDGITPANPIQEFTRTSMVERPGLQELSRIVPD